MWLPPVSFYHSGRETISSLTYRNDCRMGTGFRRVLIKRTIKGQGILYVNNNRFEVNENFIFIIEKPGPYLYCYEGNGTPWEFEYISIQMNSEDNLLPPWCINKPVFDLQKHDDLQNNLSNMITDFQKSKFNLVESSGLAYQLYLKVINRFSADFAYSADINYIVNYLKNNISEEVQISKICQKLSKTPEAMIRKFKIEVGISPGQYLLFIRIEKAKQLFHQNSLGLKEIASLCGFNSLNYFIRAFKKATGMTPKTYRENIHIHF